MSSSEEMMMTHVGLNTKAQVEADTYRCDAGGWRQTSQHIYIGIFIPVHSLEKGQRSALSAAFTCQPVRSVEQRAYTQEGNNTA